MDEGLAYVETKTFSKMFVNPKLRELIRSSKHLNKPIAYIDYQYQQNKGGFGNGLRDNKNLEGIITFRKMRYRKSKIINNILKKAQNANINRIYQNLKKEPLMQREEVAQDKEGLSQTSLSNSKPVIQSIIKERRSQTHVKQRNPSYSTMSINSDHSYKKCKKRPTTARARPTCKKSRSYRQPSYQRPKTALTARKQKILFTNYATRLRNKYIKLTQEGTDFYCNDLKIRSVNHFFDVYKSCRKAKKRFNRTLKKKFELYDKVQKINKLKKEKNHFLHKQQLSSWLRNLKRSKSVESTNALEYKELEDEEAAAYTLKTANQLLIKLSAKPRRSRSVDPFKENTKYFDSLFNNQFTFKANIDKIKKYMIEQQQSNGVLLKTKAKVKQVSKEQKKKQKKKKGATLKQFKGGWDVPIDEVIRQSERINKYIIARKANIRYIKKKGQNFQMFKMFKVKTADSQKQNKQYRSKT